jgi:hypothetical protein
VPATCPGRRRPRPRRRRRCARPRRAPRPARRPRATTRGPGPREPPWPRGRALVTTPLSTRLLDAFAPRPPGRWQPACCAVAPRHCAQASSRARPRRCKATVLPVLAPGSATPLQRHSDVGEPQVPLDTPAVLCFGTGSAGGIPCTDHCTSVTPCVAQILPARLFSQFERLQSTEALSCCWCWHQRRQAPARDGSRQRGWLGRDGA